jgi:Tfp pilus assembly protein PilE
MKKINIPTLLCSLILLIFTTSCAQYFEADEDVQARKALTDLMAIQEAFHADNQRYARNFSEIQKYNLTYHSGIVYMEIQSADKEQYRAISLPAESSTARVFAFDTNKGGFYEMEDLEVSQYVLGALNHIRLEQKNKTISDFAFFALLAFIFFLGVRFHIRHQETENRNLFVAFYLSLIPLGWSFSVLNYLSPKIVFSSQLTGITGSGLSIAILGILMAGWWAKNKSVLNTPSSLWSLLGMTVFISLFSGGVMVYAFMEYYFNA